MGFSDWEYYQTVYKGNLTEDDYNSFVSQAYYEILSQTNSCALKYTNADSLMLDNLKMCECSLIDAMNGYAEVPKGVNSINNDSYSVSFGGQYATESQSDAINAICQRYLQTPVNLMNRWL